MKKSLSFIFFIFTFFLKTRLLAEHKIIDIDIEREVNFKEVWYKNDRSDEENFKRLIADLKRVPTGKKMLEMATEKAAQKGFTLYDVIASGDGSLTDTSLIRRFASANPSIVTFETKSKVYLNRHLRTLDALLDFAHELTHFTYREAFNPYDHHFTLKDFIKGTIEGKGGEVDAYIVECKVLFEFFPSNSFEKSNCQKIYDKKLGVISKDLGILEFYKIGNHYNNFLKDIQKYSLSEQDLPLVSEDESLFISSAWGLPYPVAGVKEYTNIMDRVCKNDQNRLTLMGSKITRAPASKSNLEWEKSENQDTYRNMFEDYKLRCSKFLSN